MTHELREHDLKHAFRVQGSRLVVSASSTNCTRPSPDSGETTSIESQEVQSPLGSSQPSTSKVKEGKNSLRPMTCICKEYQRMWKKLISCKGVNPGKTIIETSLASIHTMIPSFPKISKLSEWISGVVFDSWQNNPHLKRGNVLEIKFVLVTPETAGKGSHPTFYFIKLKRLDMVAFNKIKAASGEPPLVSAINEDSVSTRRTWGLWVCLIEMDKVKYPLKIFSNKVNGSFLLNSMTGKNTEFAESLFEKKRMLIWENKLSTTEATRIKTCNMLHCGQ
ncbi:UNVERIFIED_CONTAM: hypothetical protein Sindi_2698500 [Sesamum indicum]